MSEYIYAGATSQSIDWMIYDSTSTVGAGLAGLVFNTAGLKAYYRIGATGATISITLVTQTATGAWLSGGFAEIDATNMKGAYRLDLPNAVYASNSFVTLYLYGATNMMPSVLRIDCRALPVDLKLVAGQTANAAASVTFPTTVSSYSGSDTSGTTTLLTRVAGVIPTNPLLTTDARLNNLDATITSRLAAASYATPPSSSDNATAVANILYVDGLTYKLKVNPDNTVNATVSGTIVNYVTIPSAVAQASVIPLRITMIRGDTLSVQLPAMGSLTGRTKLIFTAKATTNTPDAAALFQITEAGGLVTLLGSGSVTGTGSLVVANATTGLVNLTLSATATALIPATTTPYVWDCEVIGPSGTRTPISGTLLALPDVTLQAT